LNDDELLEKSKEIDSAKAEKVAASKISGFEREEIRKALAKSTRFDLTMKIARKVKSFE
jgi:hypothetical protein